MLCGEAAGGSQRDRMMSGHCTCLGGLPSGWRPPIWRLLHPISASLMSTHGAGPGLTAVGRLNSVTCFSAKSFQFRVPEKFLHLSNTIVLLSPFLHSKYLHSFLSLKSACSYSIKTARMAAPRLPNPQTHLFTINACVPAAYMLQSPILEGTSEMLPSKWALQTREVWMPPSCI